MSTRRSRTALTTRLLAQVRQQFDRVTDGNCDRRNNHSASDCLMSGLAIFMLKFPSLLKFDQGRHKHTVRGNLRRLFGVKRAPADTTLRLRLDRIDARIAHRALRTLIGWLLRHRYLDPFRTEDGALPLAIDGTGYFTSTKVHCKRCLQSLPRGGGVRYHHAALGAVLVHPAVRQVMPVAVEPVVQQDGDTKQDCELSAFKRLLARLLKERGGTRFIAIMDALYAVEPVVSQLRAAGHDFILTMKDERHAYAMRQLRGDYRACTQDTKVWYRWQTRVPLNAEHADTCQVTVVERVAIPARGGIERKLWATNRPVASVADARAVADLASKRWRIENNTFKTLKDENGYHFEHNYGHGGEHLCTLMMLLMFLAFAIDQVLAMSCARFQAAVAWAGATREVWSQQRALFTILPLASWDALYALLSGALPDD